MFQTTEQQTNHLDLLRQDLVEHYSKVESNLQHFIDSTTSGDDIFDNFRNTFSYSENFDFTLTFIPDIHKELKRVWKDQGQSQSVTQGLLLSRGMPIKSRRSFGRTYLIIYSIVTMMHIYKIILELNQMKRRFSRIIRPRQVLLLYNVSVVKQRPTASKK